MGETHAMASPLRAKYCNNDSNRLWRVRDLASINQQDLFGGNGQSDLFGAPEPVDYTPKPDEVRTELVAMLAEIRSADTMPWHQRKLRLNRTIFPQMTNWLPDKEGEQLRFEFEAQLQPSRCCIDSQSGNIGVFEETPN